MILKHYGIVFGMIIGIGGGGLDFQKNVEEKCYSEHYEEIIEAVE